jgi:regulator of replication initiation timing
MWNDIFDYKLKVGEELLFLIKMKDGSKINTRGSFDENGELTLANSDFKYRLGEEIPSECEGIYYIVSKEVDR